MNARDNEPQNRASGLIGTLNPTETLVVKSLLSGRSPGLDLARARGRERATAAEARDVARVMADERVRRTIAGVTNAIRPSDLRRYIVERLITEAEDAKEGSTRIKALELVGNLPGVGLWTPEPADVSTAATGAELAEALTALEARLGGVIEGESQDLAGVEPAMPGEDMGDKGEDMSGEDDARAHGRDGEDAGVQPEPNHRASGRLPFEDD